MKTLNSLLLLAYFILSFGGTSIGQSKYGNEWIDHSKTYYKLKVATNGVFKVTYDQLAKAGFPSAVKSADLKLFNLGVEKPIFVSTNNNFGPGDFIEFIGEPHTIGVDSLMYADWKNELFNPRYSLTTDTNVYFLTISPTTNNLRINTATPDYDNNSLTPSAFCIYDESIIKSNAFYKGKDGEIQQSIFEPSEGFGDAISAFSSHKFFATGFKTSGIKPLIRFRYGQGAYNTSLRVTWNDRELDVVNSVGKINVQKAYNLDNNDISAPNTLFLKNIASDNDRHRLAFATLTYTRDFDFGSSKDVTFTMPAATARRYIELSKSEGSTFAYDTKRNIRYPMRINGSQHKLLIDGATTAITYFIPATIDTVLSVSVFKPQNWNDDGTEYIILSDPILQGPQNALDQYASYRSTSDGGSYKTKIVYAHDLYDEFAFGATYHPMSVKNFAAWVHEKWASSKMIMVLGKGVEYPNMRRPNDVINNYHRFFFVPTFGLPGSDVLAFAKGNDHFSRLAVGRLAAKTDIEVLDYLDKIKSYEGVANLPRTSQDRIWTKKVLHLGGGKNPGEQNSIKAGLEGFGKVIADTTFGGYIASFYKNSFDAVQFSVNEEINKKLNDGISILNFFGHSASTSWDFSLQNPRDFKNENRYPFITSFGCYSGNLFSTSSNGISESFVIQPKKAGISFYASTGTAFIGSLSEYGRSFYKYALNTDKDKTIGEVINKQGRDNQIPKVNPTEFSLYTQLVFHGDPALRFYNSDAPDYTFDYSSIKRQVTTAGNENMFNFSLDINNIGAYKGDSVDVYFYYQLSDGSNSDTLKLNVKLQGAITPINFSLNNPGFVTTGRNILHGYVDYSEKITEIDENNNSITSLTGSDGYEFFISGNVAVPIYPPNYAMINTKDHYILRASTSIAPLTSQKYIIQIDSTRDFNSTSLEVAQIQSQGGLIEYKPQSPLRTNSVYYWRISPDSTTLQGYQWQQSSFVYLPNEEEGWNQSHFFQFSDDEYKDLEISKETNRKFQFGKEYFNIKIRNKIWNDNDKPSYLLSNVRTTSMNAWDYMDAGIGIIINNPINMWHLLNPIGGAFGSFNPTGKAIRVYSYPTNTPESRKQAMDFIENNLKDGYFLTFYTIQKNATSSYSPEDWESDQAIYGKTLFSVLEKYGATRINDLKLKGSVPYILQLQNKDGGFFSEVIATDVYDIIENDEYYSALKLSGKVVSTIIGPAKEWINLKYQVSDLLTPKDKSSFNVFGVKNNGEKTKLYENYQSSSSLSVDANTFPYLKIEKIVSDSLDRSSPQLNFWRTSFKGLPDAAVSLNNSSSIKDEIRIKQGEEIKIKYDIVNVSTSPMDSILVKYTLTDEKNQNIETYKRLSSLPVGKTISDELLWNTTTSLTGSPILIIEINPNNDQPELNKFNNTLYFNIKVAPDDRNPNLMVYFDGIQILDGDIVSSKPDIKVTLRDDNPLIPITSSDRFEISLDTAYNRTLEIPMNSPQIKFTPATSQNGEAYINYTPNLKDGDYTLRVQGKDMAGNKSGAQPRTVNFRVISEESVTQVLNYPNPFSTSTQFIFTLTGQEIPDVLSITIMTMSGKVVREITKDQLGPLRIGINRTDYKWDGTDDFGSKLANGVYLYKVNIRNKAGEQFKKRNEYKLDDFFKNGIGKLVIIR